MGMVRPLLARKARGKVLCSVVLLLLTASACGGGNGGNGGGNPAQTAQSCGGTIPDAQVMANWTHRQLQHFAFFIPDPNWLSVESANSIDISSPTGDAVATFAFAYGVAVPTTIAGLEDVVWMGYASHQIIAQSQIVAGGPGQEQTVEFTGLWNYTNHQVHGIFTAGVGSQVAQVYLTQANVEVWAADACTLLLIRLHITYLG
jgi:hypothetical protein